MVIQSLIYSLRIVTCLVAFFVLSFSGFSQEQRVLWQHTFGGEGDDEITAFQEASDGSMIVVGNIESADLSRSSEAFVSKISENGNVLWHRQFGGLGTDKAIDVEFDQDGNILMLLSSTSTTGIFEGNRGYSDFYLLQLNADGFLLSMKNYGGSFIDIPVDLLVRDNGNILLAGHSRSTDHDVESNNGQVDLWLSEINPVGDVVWKRSIGGSDEEYLVRVAEATNGDLFVLGNSNSYDEDIAENYGDLDIILFKLDSHGETIWQKNYGGHEADFASDLLVLSKNEVLIVGNTFSSNIDVGKNAGFSDAWVLEVNGTGDLEWETTFGDVGSDFSQRIVSSEDGRARILGSTRSSTFLDNPIEGAQGIWTATLTENYQIEDLQIIGSSGYDEAVTVRASSNGNILMAGKSSSSDHFAMNNQGQMDGWIALLEKKQETDVDVIVHPNPSNGIFYVNGMEAGDRYSVYSSSGQQIIMKEYTAGTSLKIDISSMQSGIYFLHVRRGEEVKRVKLVRI